MKPTIYLETSVVSFLAARSSKDLVIAGEQESTHRWWNEKRKNYDLYISKLVWQEAAQGNAVAAQRRLKFIRSLKWLQLTKDVFTLAHALIERNAVPPNAGNDALHIALGAVYGLQFLLTWNFTHINNPATEEQVRSICREHDFHCPVICSPDQMLSL
jgi:predicted nucleic acid-binding protein